MSTGIPTTNFDCRVDSEGPINSYRETKIYPSKQKINPNNKYLAYKNNLKQPVYSKRESDSLERQIRNMFRDTYLTKPQPNHNNEHRYKSR